MKQDGSVLAAIVLAIIAVTGFFVFPGHTWLHQDSQIYLPMILRIESPQLLERDLIATHPHLSFTVFDEITVAVKKLSALDYRTVLGALQVLSRYAALWGVYLMALSTGLSPAGAIFTAGVFALGAAIPGPAVLTFEYEPTPRSFAIPLLLLAAGLATRQRYVSAGTTGALALLIHPPSAYPFWAVYAVKLLRGRPGDGETPRRVILVPLWISIGLALLFSRLQPGTREPQVFFQLVDPAWQSLELLRASYNWVSTWPFRIVALHVVLWIVSLAAFLRLRGSLNTPMRWMMIGMPLTGILSMPASYVLLDKMKWALMPQFQPMRAVLFITVFAVIGCVVMALRAAEAKRWLAAGLWLAPAMILPAFPRLPDDFLTAGLERLPVVLGLIVLGVGTAAALKPMAKLGPATAGAFVLAAMWAYPYAGKISNYPTLHSTELNELSQWAKSSTESAALFHFPDAKKALYPGIFRTKAERAVYVDWKGGGQVNFMRSLALEWWNRWNTTLAARNRPDIFEEAKSIQADYVVLREPLLASVKPVFRNKLFAVYRVAR